MICKSVNRLHSVMDSTNCVVVDSRLVDVFGSAVAETAGYVAVPSIDSVIMPQTKFNIMFLNRN